MNFKNINPSHFLSNVHSRNKTWVNGNKELKHLIRNSIILFLVQLSPTVTCHSS